MYVKVIRQKYGIYCFYLILEVVFIRFVNDGQQSLFRISGWSHSRGRLITLGFDYITHRNIHLCVRVHSP